MILGEKENFLMLNIKKCYVYNQQRSQDFSLEVAKLKDNIKSEINLKILINNNNKINKQL